MSHPGWSLGRRGGLTLAAVAVVAALVLVAIVIRAQVSAPEPRSAGRIDPPAPSHRSSQSSSDQSSAGKPGPVPLPPSRPLSIRIPAIGVDTPVYPIGLAPDGTLAVPQPGPHLNNAAWFENSPTPGQPGPAIIEGHVDSVEGPSVFFELGAVKPGDRIFVRRQDGRMLTFEVNAVRDFLKAEFPTTLEYGSQQANAPTLRLITCSDFDTSIEHHVGNEVVFAHLTHVSGRSGPSNR
jgi:LPXTG-site transpeptidase (sortase) family protein